jgi:hypothetical protein
LKRFDGGSQTIKGKEKNTNQEKITPSKKELRFIVLWLKWQGFGLKNF